jgi:hypothetical protein
MKLSRFTAPALLFAACVFADPSGGINYGLSQSTSSSSARKYHFVGWPAGSGKPVYFRSGIYAQGDSATFLRLDDGKRFGGKESAIRFPEAFDSLRASRTQPVFIAGSEYSFDHTWVTAKRVGRRWVFPRVTGEITLWTKAPGARSYVFMDTGAGMQRYDEQAVRRKLSSRPESAAWLRQERFGKNAAWAMALGGAGLSGIGVATSFGSEGFEPNGLVFAGITLAAFSWMPHLMVQGLYEKALYAYNAAAPARAP